MARGAVRVRPAGRHRGAAGDRQDGPAAHRARSTRKRGGAGARGVCRGARSEHDPLAGGDAEVFRVCTGRRRVAGVLDIPGSVDRGRAWAAGGRDAAGGSEGTCTARPARRRSSGARAATCVAEPRAVAQWCRASLETDVHHRRKLADRDALDPALADTLEGELVAIAFVSRSASELLRRGLELANPAARHARRQRRYVAHAGRPCGPWTAVRDVGARGHRERRNAGETPGWRTGARRLEPDYVRRRQSPRRPGARRRNPVPREGEPT